jgi:hypothetical protein
VNLISPYAGFALFALSLSSMAHSTSFSLISLFHELPARGGSRDHAGESEIISSKEKQWRPPKNVEKERVLSDICRV